MSDDMWRRTGDDHEDENDDFGELRFSDDEPAPLSFGDAEQSTLPHWTEPPTGEIPRLFPESSTGSAPRPRPDTLSFDDSDDGDDDDNGDSTDDVDIWGSYSGAAPRPVPDRPAPTSADTSGSRPRVRLGEPSGGVRRDPSGPMRREPSGPMRRGDDTTASGPMVRRSADTSDTRRTGRVTIAGDDTAGRPVTGSRPRPSAGRGPRPDVRRPAPRPSARGTGGRDMPTAVTAGLIIAAAFIGALMWKPVAVLAIVVLVCGLAAVEFFDKITSEGGYSPAIAVGIAACIAAPLAAYWVGEGALPLVLVLSLMACGATFVGASDISAGPVPNIAITSLGIMWIGLMGSYAALIAGVSNVPGLGNAGTDTLFIVAVGVVANDVGALFVGSAAGRTPLREWISPNKTLEGFLGGGLATLVAVIVVSLQSDTWNDLREALLLGIVIALLAPLGDLVESMFKRNLKIKDFGTIIRGHGGVLDRFDGFLFVLPAAYYVLQVLEPYTS